MGRVYQNSTEMETGLGINEDWYFVMQQMVDNHSYMSHEQKDFGFEIG